MKRSKIIFLIFDILFITAAFLFFIWLKPASLRYYLPAYIKPFLGFAFLWLVTSFVGHKYNLYEKKKLSELLSPVFRIDFTILGVTVILMYVFGRFGYSRMIVFGTILSATALEIIFCIFYYVHRKMRKSDEFTTSVFYPAKFVGPFGYSVNIEKQKSKIPELSNIDDSIFLDLREKYLKEKPDVFGFIFDNIDLIKLHKDKSLVLDTPILYNIENIEAGSLQMFINLHKLNDMRRINRYFIQVNENLQYNGIFIGCAETLDEVYKRVLKDYPLILAIPIFVADFIIRRVFPKLPVFKEVYFALTKGYNRAISKAHILGRLCFCGFKIVAYRELNNLLYFITIKESLPLEDKNPSYGPFVKMKRVGKDYNLINIYKFRTMHPYSEYLQEHIYNSSKLETNGKFKDDFRITGWGRIFRKLWIDELPQLINFLRGEVSLVGVRALSEQYFQLYPEDLKELRVQFKPGIVPPYYADMPKSFEEILESERNYLIKKQKKPFSTDVKYFFKAWRNILFKGARSK